MKPLPVLVVDVIVTAAATTSPAGSVAAESCPVTATLIVCWSIREHVQGVTRVSVRRTGAIATKREVSPAAPAGRATGDSGMAGAATARTTAIQHNTRRIGFDTNRPHLGDERSRDPVRVHLQKDQRVILP